MDTLLGVLALICIIWFILGMIIPAKVAPFFKTSRRKKVFITFIVAMMAVGGISSIVDPSSSTGSKQAKQEQVYKIGDSLNTKNFEITILDKEITKSVYDKSGYLKNDADGNFVVLTVKYKNTAKEAKRIHNGDFKLTLNGNTYSPTTLLVNTENNIFLDAINPGVEKTGKLYFDVPADVANSNDFVLEMSGNLLSSNGNSKIHLSE
jgi:hypothetical protein